MVLDSKLAFWVDHRNALYMKLATIDIGSNAIRLQIVKAFTNNDFVNFEKLKYLKCSLRLGYDVFKKGTIPVSILDEFTKLMPTFKLLIYLYDVHDFITVGA